MHWQKLWWSLNSVGLNITGQPRGIIIWTIDFLRAFGIAVHCGLPLRRCVDNTFRRLSEIKIVKVQAQTCTTQNRPTSRLDQRLQFLAS